MLNNTNGSCVCVSFLPPTSTISSSTSSSSLSENSIIDDESTRTDSADQSSILFVTSIQLISKYEIDQYSSTISADSTNNDNSQSENDHSQEILSVDNKDTTLMGLFSTYSSSDLFSVYTEISSIESSISSTVSSGDHSETELFST